MTRFDTDGTRQGRADRYFELVKRFPLRPIHDDHELDQAIAMVDALLDQEGLAPEEEDSLDVLGDLIAKYEAKQQPMPKVSDAELLGALIETQGVTQAKVAMETGISESTISTLVAGKRKLNRTHITALARFFKVSPAVFLAD